MQIRTAKIRLLILTGIGIFLTGTMVIMLKDQRLRKDRKVERIITIQNRRKCKS